MLETEHIEGNLLVLSGVLNSESAGELPHLLKARAQSGELTLDLWGVEIADGMGLTALINELRRLKREYERLILAGAPQMLGHNLYRVGLLDDRIELVDMQEDEPYG